MNCKSCKIEVPPNFAKAIVDNKCPACGQEIMSGKEYREMRSFVSTLAPLKLDDRLSIMISASLCAKFDLVPKGQVKEPVEKTENIEEVEDKPTADMTEEELRDKALEDAKKEKLIAEWGLDKKPDLTVKGTQIKDNAFSSLFAEPPDLDVEDAFSQNKNLNRLERLAKASAMRDDPSARKINRL